jgi:hypothetical protein
VPVVLVLHACGLGSVVRFDLARAWRLYQVSRANTLATNALSGGAKHDHERKTPYTHAFLS